MSVALVIFVVNGVRWHIPIDVAAELIDSITQPKATSPPPSYAAASMIDRLLAQPVEDESQEWQVPEKDALRRVLEDWLGEPAGTKAFPPSVMDLRYALYAEWQDELPAGLYHFILDLGNAEPDEIRPRERAPLPGQAVTFTGESFIIDKIVSPRRARVRRDRGLTPGMRSGLAHRQPN